MIMCLEEEFFFCAFCFGWMDRGAFSRLKYETPQLGGSSSYTLDLTLTLARRASTTSATTTRPSRRPPWTNWRQRASHWRTTTSSPSARRHAASSSPAGTDITSCFVARTLPDFLISARFIPHLKNKVYLPWHDAGCSLGLLPWICNVARHMECFPQIYFTYPSDKAQTENFWKAEALPHSHLTHSYIN